MPYSTVRNGHAMAKDIIHMSGKNYVKYTVPDNCKGVKYFLMSLTSVARASALSSLIISITEIGLAAPIVRSELNSPSVTKPATK